MRKVFSGFTENFDCTAVCVDGRSSTPNLHHLTSTATTSATCRPTLDTMQISEVVTVPLLMPAPGSAAILVIGQQPLTATTTGGMLAGNQAGCVTGGGSGGSVLEEPCRFPKLEECAHFHYERVQLPADLAVTIVESGSAMDLSLHSQHSTCLGDPSSSTTPTPAPNLYTVQVQSGDECWLLQRTLDNFRLLDAQLHQCIYDRKVSLLPDLALVEHGGSTDGGAAGGKRDKRWSSRRRSGVEDSELGAAGGEGGESDWVVAVLREYLRQLCVIADNSINCAPILNWLQMDNRGHRLLVPSEESRSINTPAVAAAYSVRRYVSQARDELSLEVGDMISVIDMASPGESVWWRGKRGFQVGFFPQYCVHIIGDKVPRNMPGPPPVVGSLAMSPIKPVLRKHGKLIAFFRSFILSRPSRRRLKATGILRERVFGCDLGEHLLNSGRRIPAVLRCCAEFIEAHGILDGIYRLSGVTSNIQKLRNAFDEDRVPNLYTEDILQDIHSVASLLKMYFRELPNPLCTYQLYTSFVQAIQGGSTSNATGATTSGTTNPSTTPDSKRRLLAMRETVQKLPPPHYRTLAYLMRHLARVARHASSTGMTTRNIAIVWAPNLLRCAELEVGGVAALQGVGVQAVVTEFLICYADLIFCDRLPSQSQQVASHHQHHSSIYNDIGTPFRDSCITNGSDIGTTNVLHMSAHSPKRCRPKSLAIATPTKLITLEEARTKLGRNDCGYIEVGGGPDNLPKMYHTVIDLPANHRKRTLNKRPPLTWRSFFSRTTRESRNARNQGALNKARKTSTPNISLPISLQDTEIAETDLSDIKRKLRTVKSAESLTSGHSEPNSSEMDLLAPLHSLHKSQGHNRSVSHDSYFDVLQSSHNNSEGSLLDLSEIQINFELEESEMRIFSEDESLVSSPRIQKNSATPHTHRRLHPTSSNASPSSLGLPTTTSSFSGHQPSPKKQARLHHHHSSSSKPHAPQPPGMSSSSVGRRAEIEELDDNSSGHGLMFVDCLRVDSYCDQNVTVLGGGVTVVTSGAASKRSKLEEQLSEDIAFIDSCTTSRGESPVGVVSAQPLPMGVNRANTTITSAIVHKQYEPSSTVIISSESREPSQYYPQTSSSNMASINLSSTTPLFTPQTPGYMPLMAESSSPGTPNTPDTPLTDIAYQTLSGKSPIHDDNLASVTFGSGRVITPTHPPRRRISPAGSPVYENVLTTISITYKSPTRTFVTPPQPIMDSISTDNMATDDGTRFEEDNVDIYEDVGENCVASIPTSVANLPIQQANENNRGELSHNSYNDRPRSLSALDEPRLNIGTPTTPLLTPDIDLLNNGQNQSLTDLSLSEVAQLDSTSRCCTSYSLPMTPEGANVSSLDAIHLLLEDDQRTASADSENCYNKDFLSAAQNNHMSSSSGLRLSLDDVMAQSFNLIEFSPCVEQQGMIQDEQEFKETRSRPVSSSSDKRKSSEREDEQMLGCASSKPDDNEIYQQVKYLRRSIHEINSLVLDSTTEINNTQPTKPSVDYENMIFSNNDQIQDKVQTETNFDSLEPELNPVFELHTAIEQTQEPLESQTQPFGVYENVDFYKDSLESEEVKPEVLHRALITSVDVLSGNNSINNVSNAVSQPSSTQRVIVGPTYEKSALPPCLRARNLKKHNLPVMTRSLDEDEFKRDVMMNVEETTMTDLSVQSLNRRKSFDDNFKVNSLPKSLNKPKRLPPLESIGQEHLLHELHSTSTDKSDDKQPPLDTISQNTTQQLNRERIERYKEERRRFLHEKYKSESFRSTEKINQIQIPPKKEIEPIKLKPQPLGEDDVQIRESKTTSVRDTIRKLDSQQEPITNSPSLSDRSSTSIRSRTALFEVPQLRSSTTSPSHSTVLLKRSSQKEAAVDVPLIADGSERRRHTYDTNVRERDRDVKGDDGTGGAFVQKQAVSVINRRTSLDERGKVAGPGGGAGAGAVVVNRKEKMSPSYNIRDMKAIFESKSQQ